MEGLCVKLNLHCLAFILKCKQTAPSLLLREEVKWGSNHTLIHLLLINLAPGNLIVK